MMSINYSSKLYGNSFIYIVFTLLICFYEYISFFHVNEYIFILLYCYVFSMFLFTKPGMVKTMSLSLSPYPRIYLYLFLHIQRYIPIAISFSISTFTSIAILCYMHKIFQFDMYQQLSVLIRSHSDLSPLSLLMETTKISMRLSLMLLP